MMLSQFEKVFKLSPWAGQSYVSQAQMNIYLEKIASPTSYRAKHLKNVSVYTYSIYMCTSVQQ